MKHSVHKSIGRHFQYSLYSRYENTKTWQRHFVCSYFFFSLTAPRYHLLRHKNNYDAFENNNSGNRSDYRSIALSSKYRQMGSFAPAVLYIAQSNKLSGDSGGWDKSWRLTLFKVLVVFFGLMAILGIYVIVFSFQQ